MTSTVFLIGTAASLLALVIRRERRRYRERTQVDKLRVVTVNVGHGIHFFRVPLNRQVSVADVKSEN